MTDTKPEADNIADKTCDESVIEIDANDSVIAEDQGCIYLITSEIIKVFSKRYHLCYISMY